MKSLRVWRLFVAGLAALGVLAIASPASAAPDVSGELLNPGTLLVGSDIPYTPFEFGNPPDYKGYDISVVDAITRRLDLAVEYKDTYFDTIFTDLWKRKFDLVASATTITPERKKMVDFSLPYYDAQLALVVRRGSPIRFVRQLKGARIGVHYGTTAEDFAITHFGHRTMVGYGRAKNVVGFRTTRAVLRAVKSGKVDAAIVDQPTAATARRHGWRAIKNPQNFSIGESYGLATSKETPKLRRAINWALREIQTDGTFGRIYRKWFGINPPKTILP